MALIDVETTFKFEIVDAGVGITKNGFPQWVAVLRAVEAWDSEEQVWTDWSGEEANEITAYLTLMGKTGETLNVRQLMNAIGWSGASFQELNDMDLSSIIIQGRVEARTYEGKTTFQVAWIDEKNAEPGRAVKKLNSEEIKKLDAQFKGLLSGAKVKTPVKAAKPSIPPKVKKKPLKNMAKAQVPLPEIPISPPEASAPLSNSNILIGKCTRQEAWNTVVELRTDDISDSKLAEIWLKTIKDVTGKTKQDEVTEEEWFQIRETVLDSVGKF